MRTASLGTCAGAKQTERDRSGSQRHPEPPRRMPGNTALWFPLLAILAAPRWKEVGHLCASTKAQADRPRSQAGL